MNYIKVDVIINDRVAPKYISDDGEADTYIEGRIGSDYTLRIRNTSGNRILVVPSVDGLSVLDGKAANHDSGGYVLNGYETVNIPGWKVDSSTAAKFTFGAAGKSYTVKSGNTATNVGVIGVAVVGEKISPEEIYDRYVRRPGWNRQIDIFGSGWGDDLTGGSPLQPYYGVCGQSVGASVTRSMSKSASVGTEFGKATEFNTSSTTFNRDRVLESVNIYYASAAELLEVGINVNQNRAKKVKPQAFGSFCTPPIDWKK